ncbi:MAG: TCP-1/cpn60 chaperonin family protein, partial [Thermoplasmata archaeon]
GINLYTGGLMDMKREHVLEPLRVGRQAIESATDATVMVLRIDDVIASKGEGPMPPGGGPPGMGEEEY